MQFLDIITVLTTFLTALIGIRGKTWDNEKAGIRKLTITGWLGLCVALIALAMAFIQINTRNQSQKRKDRIQKIVLQELYSNNEKLYSPFWELIGTQIDTTSITFYHKSFCDSSHFNQIIDKYIIRNPDFINLELELADVEGKESMLNYIGSSFQEWQTKTNYLIDLYGDYIPVEVLLTIEELRKDQLYNLITEDLPILMKLEKQSLFDSELIQINLVKTDKRTTIVSKINKLNYTISTIKGRRGNCFENH